MALSSLSIFTGIKILYAKRSKIMRDDVNTSKKKIDTDNVFMAADFRSSGLFRHFQYVKVWRVSDI